MRAARFVRSPGGDPADLVTLAEGEVVEDAGALVGSDAVVMRQWVARVAADYPGQRAVAVAWQGKTRLLVCPRDVVAVVPARKLPVGRP